MAITFTDNSSKTKEPILTKKLFELLKWVYCTGYRCGANSIEMEEGFMQLLNDYFGESDDNGLK